MGERESTGRRSPRGGRRRRERSRSKDGEKSSSPAASPGSWNVDRGRSRMRRSSNAFSEEVLRRRGYHSLHSSFGKVFHVEKRWKLVREMGSGAYGVVVSAADDISGETVAIKLVTRVFDKIQLAKRALREITLLRHLSHENITGLIDVDAISPDFNEIYIFMEPMEADLHQIIKSGQILTNEHVQYFTYQILRGMKYVHSASVIHRDLKPGNLLVNADCELKICDFGLSRGFESSPDREPTRLTEYVATRWYRAPEIMLAFTTYSTAIDVWSIGCILAELLLSKPLFKGKDYVDQLNKVLELLGTPEESVIQRIASDKAQAYVRSLPYKKKIPFRKILPSADPQAVDLLTKMLAFDPAARITVLEALEHPWLSAYHDESDEPSCPHKFEKWRMIEQLETLDEFRAALWNEIEDFRREARGMKGNAGLVKLSADNDLVNDEEETEHGTQSHPEPIPEITTEAHDHDESQLSKELIAEESADGINAPTSVPASREGSLVPPFSSRETRTPTDPLLIYARRSSVHASSRAGSTYTSPKLSHQVFPSSTITDGPLMADPGTLVAPGNVSNVAFPSRGHGSGYVIPARSRTSSIAGGEVTRKLLRTLSTVSIYESVEGLPGGLAGIAPIGKYIVQKQTTEADAPPSEMPKDFRIDELRDDSEKDPDNASGNKNGSAAQESTEESQEEVLWRRGKFHLGPS